MEKLNRWLTLLANAGVLVGVFVVAYELRQNRIAMEATSRQEFAAQDMDYLATAIDPAIVAVALDKNEAGEALSSLELSQLVHRQHMNFRVFENAFYQKSKGTLEESEWQRYAQIIRMLICRDAPAQHMWTRFRRGFVPEFVQVVERSATDCAG